MLEPIKFPPPLLRFYFISLCPWLRNSFRFAGFIACSHCRRFKAVFPPKTEKETPQQTIDNTSTVPHYSKAPQVNQNNQSNTSSGQFYLAFFLPLRSFNSVAAVDMATTTTAPASQPNGKSDYQRFSVFLLGITSRGFKLPN